MAGSSSATEAASHNQNGLIKNQTRKGKERAMQEEQSVDDNFMTGYVSDEQPSDLLVSKAVKLIRNKANLPKRDTYLKRAVEEYGTNHPNHLFAKQPHSILYPSLYSGPSHHFHLQPQFQYKSTPDTMTWLNQMEWIVEGGKNGIPDGNEDRRRGLRGHQQRRGKGLDSQLKSYRKLEKERKDRIKEDEKWKQDYDQGRIDQGKKPYFSRRKRPDPSSDEDGNRVRIHETPELSDDEEETLALLNAPGRPDFFRRRLENSPFPVNLLRLYDEIQEWSSSSGSDLSEDEDCRMGIDFPANEQEAMRLHLKRKEVRKRRRLQRDRTDKLGNSQSHKSRSSQLQQQNQSEERENDGDVDEDGSVTEDSLLHPAEDEAQPQGGGAVDGMNLDEREVVPTSDREEALSEILSDQDFSNSMRKEDSDTSAELEVAAGAVEDEEMNLVQRQEADWDKEDQDRQRHSKTPSISQSRSQRSDQPPASGSKSSRSGGGKEKEPSESISARRDSNASSTQRIPFAASPKSQSKSSYPAPSHSTPIRKSQGSSKNKGSNSLPPSQTQKSTSSSRRQGPSSSLNNQMEEDAPVQEPQAPNRSQDERNRIIAIAQATTTSQSTFDKSSLIDDPRFESHNLNTTSMTQPTTRTNELTKASSSRRGPSSQTSGRGNGKASSAIDLQKEKERVRNERQVERNDDKGKEREDEEEEEEEVDQLDSLQSRSESQPQAILEKKQAEPQDDFDRFLTKDANSKNKGRPTASSIMEEDDRQKSLEQEGADDARQTPKGKGKAVIGTSGVGSTTPSNSVSKPTTPRSALQPPFRPRPSNQPISPFQQTETMVTLNSQSPDVDHRFGKGEPTFRVTSASSPNPNRSNRDESQRSNASSSRLSNKSKSQTDNPGSSLVDTPPRPNKGSNLNPNKDSSSSLSSPSNKNQLTPSKFKEGNFLSPTSSRSSSSSKKHGSNRSYSSHTSLLMATALQGSPSIRERNNSSRSNGGGLDRSLNQPQAQNLDESLEEDQLDDREPTPTFGNQEKSRSSSNHQIIQVDEDEEEDEQDVSTTSMGNISNSLPTKLNKSPSSSSKSSPLGRAGKVSSLSQSLMNSSKNKRRVEDSEKSFKKKNSSGSGSSSSLKKARGGSQEGSGKKGGMESLGEGYGTAKSSGNSVYFTGSNGGDVDVDVDVEDESSSPNSAKGKKRAREGKEDRTPKRKRGDEDGGSVMRMLGLQEEDEAPSPSAVQVQKEL